MECSPISAFPAPTRRTPNARSGLVWTSLRRRRDAFDTRAKETLKVRHWHRHRYRRGRRSGRTWGSAQEQGCRRRHRRNLAARLQGRAEPGSVVIAETTKRLLGGVFELTLLGPQTLKALRCAGSSLPTVLRALSRYRNDDAERDRCAELRAGRATTSRHVVIAAAPSTRCD